MADKNQEERDIWKLQGYGPFIKVRNRKDGKTMSAPEMGRLLGLKKTETYWLIHKNVFETMEMDGEMRVVRDSFEKWYAGQQKYHKVTGEEPGEELRKTSYSVRDICEILDVTEDVTRYLIDRYSLPTITVVGWKRVPREAFEKWYQSQNHYRNQADRDKDREAEEGSITMPQMAKIMGVTRNTVYSILRSRKYKDELDVVVIAGKKRITKASFDRWYEEKGKYLQEKFRRKKSRAENTADRTEPAGEKEPHDDTRNRAAWESLPAYVSVEEAIRLAGINRRTFYNWADKGWISILHLGAKLTRVSTAELKVCLYRNKSLREGETVDGGNNQEK